MAVPRSARREQQLRHREESGPNQGYCVSAERPGSPPERSRARTGLWCCTTSLLGYREQPAEISGCFGGVEWLEQRGGKHKTGQEQPDGSPGPSVTAAEHGFAWRAFRYEELTVPRIKRLSFPPCSEQCGESKLVIFLGCLEIWVGCVALNSTVTCYQVIWFEIETTQTQEQSFIVQTRLLEESLLHLSSVWG